MSGVNRHERESRRQRGFTLVELMLTLVVAGLAALGTMAVFRAQSRAANTTRTQIDAQQNARAAMDILVRELRQAGANTDKFHRQAGLVDAAPYQIVFNGDVRSETGGDGAMESTDDVPLADGTTYSPGDFLDENLEELSHFNNGAETVRLSFDANNDGAVTGADTLSTTAVAGDYQLVREINGGADESVALGLRGPLARDDGTKPPPVFQYWGTFNGATTNKLWGDTSNDGELSQSEIAALTPVSRAELKNIREIAVTIEALSDDSSQERVRLESSSTMLTTTVRPRNIGLNSSNLSACGYPPTAPTNMMAVDTPDDGGRSITVTFNASYDDVGGENDVREYSIYRRRVGQSSFGGAIYHIKAANQTTYAFINDQSHSKRAEDAPEDGVGYEYYVTAWDCEPQESNPSDLAGPVVSEPNGPEPPTITEAFDTPCDAGGDITVNFTASSDDQSSQPEFTGYRIYRGTSPGITAYKVRVQDVSATNAMQYTAHDLTNTLLPMSPDSSYYYAVRGVRFDIESVDSNQWGPVFVSDGLARPTLRAVDDMSGDFGQRLEVKWDASPSEACTAPHQVTSYEVLRRSQYETILSPVHTESAAGNPAYSFQDTLVMPAVTFTYVIRANDASGEHADSEAMSGIGTAENNLVPPIAFHADDEPCDPVGAIRLSWTASPNDVAGEMTHYRVFRGTAPGVYDFELPMVDATGQTTYSVLDDQNRSGSHAPVLGVTYYYVGRTWNEYWSLQSSNSNESSVLAESTPTSPDMNSVMDTPNDGGRSITVTFNRSDHDGSCDNTVTSYKLYRGTSPGVVGTLVGTVTALQMPIYTFVDNLVYSLDPPLDGVQYYYAARAYANELVSKLSNVAGPVMAIRDGVINEVVFSDNFETNKGWSHGASYGVDYWVRGVPRGTHGSTYGNPDPTAAVSGTLVYGTRLALATGIYGRDSSTWAMSPMVDCRTANNVKIVFKRWLNVEKNSRDQADIEVKVKNGTWTRVWRNPTTDVTDNVWSTFELDITAQAANKEEVQVRFILTSNSSREYTGWNIDDFSIEKW